MLSAIKIAIENGYLNEEHFKLSGKTDYYVRAYHSRNINPLEDDYYEWTYQGNDTYYHKSISSTLLDPLFWQCLGKRLGWMTWAVCMNCGVKVLMFRECDCEDIEPEPQMGWEWYWHKFIHHLAEGKSIDSFFEDLIKIDSIK